MGTAAEPLSLDYDFPGNEIIRHLECQRGRPQMTPLPSSPLQPPSHIGQCFHRSEICFVSTSVLFNAKLKSKWVQRAILTRYGTFNSVPK